VGFALRCAASGHEALAALTGGYRPDAVLMDLAMPGIDGWESIRRLRALGLQELPVAVVSANAFEKGQENELGIAAADFITKPVRHAELLDWLGQRLQLSWSSQAASSAALPAETLAALHEALQLGYYRGVLQQLDALARLAPERQAFVEQLRELARQFQFDTMSQLLSREQSP
jgi:CheY-like chemotaxis protein